MFTEGPPFGLSTCMNLSPLLSFSLLVTLHTTEALGRSGDGPRQEHLLDGWKPSSSDLAEMDDENFLTWRRPCLVCKKKLTNGRGLFCANFCTNKGTFRQCRVGYCGECYRVYGDYPFPVQMTLDDEEEGEEKGFEV